MKLSSYYGFGNVTVPIEIYTFTIMDVAVTVTVGKKDCVLLGEHYVVPGSMVDSGFMGVTLGIKNPAVFDVPAKCKMCRKSNFAHVNLTCLFIIGVKQKCYVISIFKVKGH